MTNLCAAKSLQCTDSNKSQQHATNSKRDKSPCNTAKHIDRHGATLDPGKKRKNRKKKEREEREAGGVSNKEKERKEKERKSKKKLFKSNERGTCQRQLGGALNRRGGIGGNPSSSAKGEQKTSPAPVAIATGNLEVNLVSHGNGLSQGKRLGRRPGISGNLSKGMDPLGEHTFFMQMLSRIGVYERNLTFNMITRFSRENDRDLVIREMCPEAS
ncbi:hypothetical protein CEXT_65041 [Caerostris extrusa]|uniref:Uncharacterized protein n=1 Tax=Caerostris extrusa TaxID=172846 RepID=A0AAV4WHU6_CAEEX|nr:hypothetical protein CEXT_65041 [Caerostris extrusa]